VTAVATPTGGPTSDAQAAGRTASGDGAATRRPPIRWRTSWPYLAIHLVPLLALVTGVHLRDLLLLVALYWVRLFCITAGYHRYFAHRAYRLNRFWQFLLAFGGTTAVQRGPLWWAAHHRWHHQYADEADDVHSPRDGFWWSHIGWILSGAYGATRTDRIRDFAAYPELRFLDRNDWIGPWMLGIACVAWGGWSALVVGFFGSTILLAHATFSVNSLAHRIGRRRYDTPDTSRNSWIVALIAGGEGWHNNHHHYQSAARQGFRWWELDVTYYVLVVLSWVGIVHDLRPVPARVFAPR
jgi:stearoyl-CoA desaturase (delta-9 desaturase)